MGSRVALPTKNHAYDLHHSNSKLGEVGYSIALTISSHIFLASPNSIIVLLR
jgi:hypothetical protein